MESDLILQLHMPRATASGVIRRVFNMDTHPQMAGLVIRACTSSGCCHFERERTEQSFKIIHTMMKPKATSGVRPNSRE